MKLSIKAIPLAVILWMCCCSSCAQNNVDETMEQEKIPAQDGSANVTQVEVLGNENAYTFNVTISSPDTGCDQYADWWEVIDLQGNLLHRRILAHSHVNEQPFTRSGSPVNIDQNTEIYIRAHMNTTGYGTTVFKGTVASGLASSNLEAKFAKELEETAPLPDGCAF